jgi:hypothetical protein
VSLKYGDGNGTDSLGRFFQYYDEKTVDELFKNDPRLELTKKFNTSSHGAGEATSIAWLNLILKRRGYFD